jgi:hypothetical protein
VELVDYVLEDLQDQVQYFQQLKVQVEEEVDLIQVHLLFQVLQEDQVEEQVVQQQMLLKVVQETLHQ